MANDPDMAELIDLFVGELPQRVEALLAACREHRYESVQRVAHQLRGASAGYGYPAIGRAAGLLEETIGQSPAPDLGAVARCVNDLVDLCRRASGR